MKKIIITRKVQLNIDFPKDSEELATAYQNLYAWQRYAYRAANLVASHNFVQEKVKDMIYMTEGAKVKLANIEKDETGILNTCKLNSTYKILSKEFKGKIPTAILTCINSVVTQNYNSEKKQYFTGERSLRVYKKDIPIPFQSSSVRDLKWDKGEGNYTFSLFKIPFKTFLGADKSKNKVILERILSGEYEMGDSSIQLKKGKIFLLMVVKFDKDLVQLDEEKEIVANLSYDVPIVVKYKRSTFNIGNKDEYVHRRQQIQNAIKRRQMAAKYNSGGKGRKKKTQSIEFFHRKEKDFVDTKMHQYSYQLIKLALNKKAKTIVLANVPEVKEEAQEDPFLLRNWGYYGLIEKIKYKANKWGIDVVEK